MVPGVPGQAGPSVTPVLDSPLVPGSVTALPADSEDFPAWESADKVVVAMTTSPSAQVGIPSDCSFTVRVKNE